MGVPNKSVSLRPITVDDLELMLAWRSNPDVYRYFEVQDTAPSWPEQLEWFAKRDLNQEDFVIQFNGRRVGVVSVTPEGYVSIYVGEVDLWGNGLATSALHELNERTGRTLLARVHCDNDRSKQLFEAAGYREHERDGDWIVYTDS